MPERTTISVLRLTKDVLDSMKRQEQSHDGLIQELVKFYKEKSQEYWTRRKFERESSHLPRVGNLGELSELPEFREYSLQKYPNLDEDLITMIEDLIERAADKEEQGLKDVG